MSAETGLDERTLREARTTLLARRGREVSREVATTEVLVCACGEERFGLPLSEVAQVLPARSCTPVPGAPAALLGIVSLSGGVVSVLSLVRALGRGGDDASSEAGHFVTLRGGAAPVALAVDRVLSVGRIASGVVTDASGFGDGPVSGYAPPGADGTGDFVLVDLARLLRRYRP